MLTMTISHSLSLALTASVLAVGWVMPAPATELPAPAIHKVANLATPAKKPAARQSLVRIASAESPPSADTGPRRFPVVLGVGY
jgi:hypothetical protein